MYADLVITGGSVIDGTGSPARLADIAIKDGHIARVVSPGQLSGQSHKIDATGLVVTPGFIDIHTHLDAQVFWDPSCSQSLHHGVTTAIGGNCGFSVAPLRESDDGYIMRMLAAVEEIPLGTLEGSVPWNWRSTADYLDRVEAARPVVNMGFLVGHSALRHAVMGEDAVGGTPTAAQLNAMGALLLQSLREGGLGFSSSWNTVHFDGEDNPVPSRAAGADELLSLCSVVKEVAGTQVEFIPPISSERAFDDARTELLTRMSLVSERTVNWNLFQPRADDACLSQLRASEVARAAGARVVALTYPGVMRGRRSFSNSPVFADLTGSKTVTTEQRLRLLSDASARHRIRQSLQARTADGSLCCDISRLLGLPIGLFGVCPIDDLMVLDATSPDLRRYEQRRVGDIAVEVGIDPFDLLCDLAVADRLRIGFMVPLRGVEPEAWRIRDASWRNPNVILGASDAGAHVQSLSTFDWATAFLELNRRRQVLTLEEAVHRVTGVQADLYGLVGRGRIGEGCFADIAVFDAGTIGPEPARWTEDLPGSAGRLLGKARGLEHVLVSGIEVLRRGQLTGAQPGRVLRSGRDTVTLSLSSTLR
jgi:N-acyl-D-aspartate/D-glutamate deacylase